MAASSRTVISLLNREEKTTSPGIKSESFDVDQFIILNYEITREHGDLFAAFKRDPQDTLLTFLKENSGNFAREIIKNYHLNPYQLAIKWSHFLKAVENIMLSCKKELLENIVADLMDDFLRKQSIFKEQEVIIQAIGKIEWLDALKKGISKLKESEFKISYPESRHISSTQLRSFWSDLVDERFSIISRNEPCANALLFLKELSNDFILYKKKRQLEAVDVFLIEVNKQLENSGSRYQHKLLILSVFIMFCLQVKLEREQIFPPYTMIPQILIMTIPLMVLIAMQEDDRLLRIHSSNKAYFLDTRAESFFQSNRPVPIEDCSSSFPSFTKMMQVFTDPSINPHYLTDGNSSNPFKDVTSSTKMYEIVAIAERVQNKLRNDLKVPAIKKPDEVVYTSYRSSSRN